MQDILAKPKDVAPDRQNLVKLVTDMKSFAQTVGFNRVINSFLFLLETTAREYEGYSAVPQGPGEEKTQARLLGYLQSQLVGLKQSVNEKLIKNDTERKRRASQRG